MACTPPIFPRIDEWVDRLGEWYSNGLCSVYFFTHEPDNVLAPELAVYLAEKAKKIGSVKIRGPKLIEESRDKQMTLF